MQTPVGRLQFVCVNPPIYNHGGKTIAGPEQAFCDFVYIALRRGLDPAGMATLRRTADLKQRILAATVMRYPVTVRRCVASMLQASVDHQVSPSGR
jgi:hypothetical protein